MRTGRQHNFELASFPGYQGDPSHPYHACSHGNPLTRMWESRASRPCGASERTQASVGRAATRRPRPPLTPAARREANGLAAAQAPPEVLPAT